MGQVKHDDDCNVSAKIRKDEFVVPNSVGHSLVATQVVKHSILGASWRCQRRVWAKKCGRRTKHPNVVVITVQHKLRVGLPRVDHQDVKAEPDRTVRLGCTELATQGAFTACSTDGGSSENPVVRRPA
jgi:hypothetical protein